MAKATTIIKQVLNYRPEQSAWFAANQSLFNQVAAFYFDVIQAHVKILDLSNKEALTALEKLTHTTQSNPTPAMPLAEIKAWGELRAWHRSGCVVWDGKTHVRYSSPTTAST